MRWQAQLTPTNPTAVVNLGFEGRSMAIYNMTPYPIYIGYSGQLPTATSYDLIVPAATSLSTALPGNPTYSLFMDLSGITVTFTSPPAVVTFDSEPSIPSFSQVHLTYPYSSNLQFLARTQQADQYVRATILPGMGGVQTLLTLSIPDGQLYIIRRAMIRVLDAQTVNQGFGRIRTIRGIAGFADAVYHYFSPADNMTWVDTGEIALVCSHQFALGDIQITVRNFSGVNPMTYQARLKIDVIEARLP